MFTRILSVTYCDPRFVVRGAFRLLSLFCLVYVTWFWCFVIQYITRTSLSHDSVMYHPNWSNVCTIHWKKPELNHYHMTTLLNYFITVYLNWMLYTYYFVEIVFIENRKTACILGRSNYLTRCFSPYPHVVSCMARIWFWKMSFIKLISIIRCLL